MKKSEITKYEFSLELIRKNKNETRSFIKIFTMDKSDQEFKENSFFAETKRLSGSSVKFRQNFSIFFGENLLFRFDLYEFDKAKEFFKKVGEIKNVRFGDLITLKSKNKATEKQRVAFKQLDFQTFKNKFKFEPFPPNENETDIKTFLSLEVTKCLISRKYYVYSFDVKGYNLNGEKNFFFTISKPSKLKEEEEVIYSSEICTSMLNQPKWNTFELPLSKVLDYSFDINLSFNCYYKTEKNNICLIGSFEFGLGKVLSSYEHEYKLKANTSLLKNSGNINLSIQLMKQSNLSQLAFKGIPTRLIFGIDLATTQEKEDMNVSFFSDDLNKLEQSMIHSFDIFKEGNLFHSNSNPITSIQNAIKVFGFGFKHQGKTFCGDFETLFPKNTNRHRHGRSFSKKVGVHRAIECYHNAMKNDDIQFLTHSNISEFLERVISYSKQQAFDFNGKFKQYIIVFIFTKGFYNFNEDEFGDVIEELFKATNFPISFVFIVNRKDKEVLEKMKTLYFHEKKVGKFYRTGYGDPLFVMERDLTQICFIDTFKQEKEKGEEKSLKKYIKRKFYEKVPLQLSQYIEKKSHLKFKMNDEFYLLNMTKDKEYEQLKKFLKSKNSVEVNYVEPKTKKSALTYAFFNEDINIIELLLHYSADLSNVLIHLDKLSLQFLILFLKKCAKHRKFLINDIIYRILQTETSTSIKLVNQLISRYQTTLKECINNKLHKTGEPLIFHIFKKSIFPIMNENLYQIFDLLSSYQEFNVHLQTKTNTTLFSIAQNHQKWDICIKLIKEKGFKVEKFREITLCSLVDSFGRNFKKNEISKFSALLDLMMNKKVCNKQELFIKSAFSLDLHHKFFDDLYDKSVFEECFRSACQYKQNLIVKELLDQGLVNLNENQLFFAALKSLDCVKECLKYQFLNLEQKETYIEGKKIQKKEKKKENREKESIPKFGEFLENCREEEKEIDSMEIHKQSFKDKFFGNFMKSRNDNTRFVSTSPSIDDDEFVFVKGNIDETPLSYCLRRYGREGENADKIILELLKHGASLDNVDETVNILHQCCFNNYFESLKYIFKNFPKYKKLVNKKSVPSIFTNFKILYPEGITPVMVAALAGKESILTFLISNGSDPLEEGPDEKIALAYACENGNITCVKVLLLLSRQVLNKGKETALICAAKNDHFHCVKELLSMTKDHSQYSKNKALYYAYVNGNENAVAKLMQIGAKVSYIPLTHLKSTKLLKTLLEENKSFALANDPISGEYFIDKLDKKKDRATIEILINHGINPFFFNSEITSDESSETKNEYVQHSFEFQCSAKDLPKKINGLMKVDTFFVIKIGKQELFKSNVIKKESNPIWKKGNFILPEKMKPIDKILIEVKSNESADDSVLIGLFETSIAEILEKKKEFKIINFRESEEQSTESNGTFSFDEVNVF